MQTDGKDRFNTADIITFKSPLTPWGMRRVGGELQISLLYFFIISFLVLGSWNNNMSSKTKLIIFKKTEVHNGQYGETVNMWTSCTCVIKNAYHRPKSKLFFFRLSLGDLKMVQYAILPSSAFFISRCTCVAH